MPPLAAAHSDEARAAAEWIVALEPWRSLGYTAGNLGSWLARMCESPAHAVRAQLHKSRIVQGLIVVQEGVLLGDFIALLAVRPEAAGQGIGRALVEDAARRSTRRWLYTSHDSRNRDAARFYAALGFARVGRLPDLIVEGRDERLLRRSKQPPGSLPR